MPSFLAAESWLKQAVSHAATKWLRDFLLTTLPKLREKSISPAAFAEALEELLLARSLTSLAQQKNSRSNVCQALKSMDPHHPAIPLVSPTTEQYRELNETQRSKLAGRETKYFSSAAADLIVERATTLLDSSEWADVAAGLAVLIGRRISEILLSSFAPGTHWSLNFSEMSKKLDNSLTIEIPTLAPAPLVLAAIERLQFSLQIDDLKADAFSEKTAKQTINQRFSLAVTERCHLHFQDLIPLRTDRENLYTHLFRACYATIAAHWFCPVTVPEHTFKSEIQGHFTISQEGHKLPNFSARANYDDYAICSADGNRDGRLGIKLGLFPDLQVLTVFRNSPSTMVIPPGAAQRRTPLRPHVPNDPSLTPITPEPSPMNPADHHLSQTIQWFTSEIDTLRAKIAQLVQERDALRSAMPDAGAVAQLQEENRQLRAQLQAIQALLGLGEEVPAEQIEVPPAAAQQSKPPAVAKERHLAPVRHPKQQHSATEAMIHRIIDKLLDWNNRQFDPSKRLRISIPIIKELAMPFGATYQAAIQRVIAERTEEIDAIHSRLLLGVRHNASVIDKDAILQSLIASLRQQ